MLDKIAKAYLRANCCNLEVFFEKVTKGINYKPKRKLTIVANSIPCGYYNNVVQKLRDTGVSWDIEFIDPGYSLFTSLSLFGLVYVCFYVE